MTAAVYALLAAAAELYQARDTYTRAQARYDQALAALAAHDDRS